MSTEWSVTLWQFLTYICHCLVKKSIQNTTWSNAIAWDHTTTSSTFATSLLHNALVHVTHFTKLKFSDIEPEFKIAKFSVITRNARDNKLTHIPCYYYKIILQCLSWLEPAIYKPWQYKTAWRNLCSAHVHFHRAIKLRRAIKHQATPFFIRYPTQALTLWIHDQKAVPYHFTDQPSIEFY